VKAPVFTVADMESAHAAGRAAARLEIATSQAAKRINLLGQIANGIVESRAACAEAAEETAEAVARTMLSALAACLPALCARHGETELRAFVRAVLPSLVDEKRITIRINPAMIPGIAEEIAALEPAIVACTVLDPLESMAPGDAQVTWQDGSAIRDSAKIRTAIEDALAALGLLEPRLQDQEMLDA
jgi:flagellar assembly protein FliH